LVSGPSYRAMSLADSTTDATSKGATLVGSRYDNAKSPFTGFGTWDDTTGRFLIVGGSGWDMPDATDITFWTAPSYNETHDAGIERMHITRDGKIGLGVSPTQPFHLEGSFTGSDRELALFKNTSTSSGSFGWIEVRTGSNDFI